LSRTSLASGIIPILNHDSPTKKSGYAALLSPWASRGVHENPNHERSSQCLELYLSIRSTRPKNQLISACTTTTTHALRGAIFRRMNAAQAMAVIDFATIATG
jgi:hypothetical protein